MFQLAAGIGLHAGGIAGFRAGWLAAAAVLAGGGALILVRGAGDGLPSRAVWLLAVIVTGVTATAWLVDHAPLSKTRLAARIDAIEPQFVRRVSEHRRGHSSCRPECPSVERVYRAPDTTTAKTILDVAALMRVRKQLVDLEPVARRRPQHFLRVRDQRTITDIRVDDGGDHMRLVITVRARRTPTRHPGPIQSDSWTSSRVR